MLKKIWKEMRWSLRTQVVVVLFVGYLFLLWEWREPWEYDSDFPDTLLIRADDNRISPDKTRDVRNQGYDRFAIGDLSNLVPQGGSPKPWMESAVLHVIHFTNTTKDAERDFNELRSRCSFIDNDTLVVGADRIAFDKVNLGESHFAIFRRRFPEWWWGHFYRPEVWLLPFWLGLIVWTIRKDRAVTA